MTQLSTQKLRLLTNLAQGPTRFTDVVKLLGVSKKRAADHINELEAGHLITKNLQTRMYELTDSGRQLLSLEEEKGAVEQQFRSSTMKDFTNEFAQALSKDPNTSALKEDFKLEHDWMRAMMDLSFSYRAHHCLLEVKRMTRYSASTLYSLEGMAHWILRNEEPYTTLILLLLYNRTFLLEAHFGTTVKPNEPLKSWVTRYFEEGMADSVKKGRLTVVEVVAEDSDLKEQSTVDKIARQLLKELDFALDEAGRETEHKEKKKRLKAATARAPQEDIDFIGPRPGDKELVKALQETAKSLGKRERRTGKNDA